MKKHYDFSQSEPNPYLKTAKRHVTIRLDEATIDYFRGIASATGIPYQSLIGLYLRECAAEKRRLKKAWTN